MFFFLVTVFDLIWFWLPGPSECFFIVFVCINLILRCYRQVLPEQWGHIMGKGSSSLQKQCPLFVKQPWCSIWLNWSRWANKHIDKMKFLITFYPLGNGYWTINDARKRSTFYFLTAVIKVLWKTLNIVGNIIIIDFLFVCIIAVFFSELS